MNEPMLIARTAANECHLLPRLANRHGLITGATGTGKTVTLQKMAESFAAIGVPVFVADVKGDLSGIGAEGVASERLMQRLAAIGIDAFEPLANTVVFWDVFGERGHPVRATVSDMGPMLLGRLLNLNDTQSGVLQLVFKIADDNGMLLLDLKDLRAMVQHVGENARSYTTEYGNVSAASIGAIQRGLLVLEQQGGDQFFGEPQLDLADLIQTDSRGRGVVNLLAAEKLYDSPQLYSTFLLWMLAELFEQLPEIGDPEKPKLVFFFDEAHLLFKGAPKALIEKIERAVRSCSGITSRQPIVNQPTKCCALRPRLLRHVSPSSKPRSSRPRQPAGRQRPPLPLQRVVAPCKTCCSVRPGRVEGVAMDWRRWPRRP